ncbi:MAG: hypothetical protein E7652_00635 [Ruminococcaceae bacterium]|nr:hypothetical protein [Oscillospiraceae bacterium]
MKKGKKVLLLAASALLLVSLSVGLTVAYFTDSDEVKNVFTVGNVDISIDEEGAEENDDGSYGQTYEDIVPGEVYPKAPTVTVEEGSLESYVRMMVTVKFENALDDTYLGDKLDGIFKGVDNEKWILNAKTVADDMTSVVYEYRYASTVAAPDAAVVLEPIFTDVQFDGEIWGNELKNLDNMQINVEGHAIQAFGFADADAAWAAFTK